MWPLLVVVALVAAGVAGWLYRGKAPTGPLARDLRADEHGIRVGPDDVIAWSELLQVSVLTTDRGPFANDFFLVLTARGRKPVPIPSILVSRILSRLQDLPGFDHDTFIVATGSCNNGVFHCWRREVSGESATPPSDGGV